MQESQFHPPSPIPEWLKPQEERPIAKIPLQFVFPPVQALSKELTKLNSTHQYRIIYLGPRWDNSAIFHKKYSQGGGYDYEERSVSKSNNFLQNSMRHNQFYRKEIYYRAFQGMNPTLDSSQELTFQSRFQGGNLDCVVKVAPDEYDLFLRIDSNTRGNIFWFYFSIKDAKRQRIRLNICNLTKTNTHYSQGLNPYVYSSTTNKWLPSPCNSTFQQQKLRYEFLYEKITMELFYQLSFEVEFNHEKEMKFAYCIPYTYADLMADMKFIRSAAEIGSIGRSLTGVDIPVVIIGRQQESKKKAVILITGRVHPGQSNSSIMVSRIMKKLCFSPEMSYLREKLITVFVPMLNPDGVILGNSRCGALGKDLNRQFKCKNQSLLPQISSLKNLVYKISQTHSIEMYLDFHGHSRKKNMFMFGPNYAVSQNLYYKCRVLPKLLSSMTPIFRYYGCNYEIPPDKKSTARAVMLTQMMIPYVYTVETSLGFYYDRNTQKSMAFDQQKWEEMGDLLLSSVQQYYEGMEQLQEYLENKRKMRREGSKNGSSHATNLDFSRKKVREGGKRDEKQVKMFQIFEEIKDLQDQISRNKKEESGSDSDSHDSRQQLQKQKLCQFTQMVSQYLQEQKQKAKPDEICKSPSKARDKQRRLIFARRKQENQKAEEDLFIQFQSDLKNKQKRDSVKSQVQPRKKSTEKDLRCQIRRVQVVSYELKRNSPTKDGGTNIFDKTMTRFKKQSESDSNINCVQKKFTKLNVRMFNFNKVISESDKASHPAFQNKQSKLIKVYQERYLPQNKNSVAPLHAIVFHSKQSSDLNNSPIANSLHEESQTEILQQSNTSECKNRQKFKYPPSFYKIRYQNAKKKLQNQQKEKSFSDNFEMKSLSSQKKEEKKYYDLISKHRKDLSLKKSQISSRNIEEDQDQSINKGLYAKINQFPLL